MKPADLKPDELARLKAVFDGSMAGLEGVEPKRLFGCDAYFVNGNIFALVWKEGRLGLRITDEGSRTELMALPGAEAWVVDSKVVRFWVLLPTAWHGRPSRLKEWAFVSWQQALQRPPKPGVTPRKGAKRLVASGGVPAHLLKAPLSRPRSNRGTARSFRRREGPPGWTRSGSGGPWPGTGSFP
jgi:hypothetical protein